MKDYLRAFFVGSSFPVTVWPFLYLGLSFTYNPIPSFKMGIVALTVPTILGLANLLYLFSERKWPSQFSNSRLWLFGGAYGLILSLYGNYAANIPTELFLLSGPLQYVTIPAATFAYAFIWRYIVKHLHDVVGITSKSK